MNRLLLSAFLLSLGLGAKSQNDSALQAFIKKNCHQTYIRLPSNTKGPDPGAPFSEIRVVDLRPDTCRIGLIVSKGSPQRELIFRTSSAAKALSAYLTDAYSNPRGHHALLVVIKKLWLLDTVIPETHQLAAFNDPPPFLGKVIFRFEAYDKVNAGFIPLT